MTSIYVASSWRNVWQPGVVHRLLEEGHTVYDFRNPEPGSRGFSWSEIDPNWKKWPPEKFVESLMHPIAEAGFTLDMTALRNCDACVLVLPCGNSAHSEIGWAAGAGKKTVVFFPPNVPQQEPELMYKMYDHIVAHSYAKLLEVLR